ncbi:MAG: hypothetical protein Q9222_006733 [Ikaeria aurantiellina]
MNQETIPMILKDILPRRNGNGRLLFTTRTTATAELCTVLPKSLIVALQPLGLEDGLEMLIAKAGVERENLQESNVADLKRLVRSVGSLPLAIDQAASYMKSYESDAKDLLKLYRSETIEQVLSWENDLSFYEEKSVVATFTPALNKIKQTAPDAITLLRVFSFCHPERIPISILQQGCTVIMQEDMYGEPTSSAVEEPLTLSWKFQAILRLFKTKNIAKPEAKPVFPTVDNLAALLNLFQSPIRVPKAIQEIERSSLAVHTKKRSEHEIRIHDLIHLLLRSMLMTTAERKGWLMTVIEIVCKALEDIKYCELPYELRSATLLDASYRAAYYLCACGLYEKSTSMHKQTWDRRKVIFGENHPDTLKSMHSVAMGYHWLGRLDQAKELFLHVVKQRRRVLGEEHSDTLSSMGGLASTYRMQQRYKEAEELQVQVMETKRRVLGEEHLDTLTSFTDIAPLYYQQERYKEAGEVQVKVVEFFKRVLGEERPSTLISVGSLALTYHQQGRYEEAGELLVQVFEKMRMVLGEEHPKRLMIIPLFVSIMERLGRNA